MLRLSSGAQLQAPVAAVLSESPVAAAVDASTCAACVCWDLCLLLPIHLPRRPGALGSLSDAALAYAVQQPGGVPGEPFALTVTRRSNQQPIFDTSGHR